MTNRRFWKLTVTVGALALLGALLPMAQAQCGVTPKQIKPAAWHAGGSGSLLKLTSFSQDDSVKAAPSIVGMWHVMFIARTMNGSAIPNTVIDNAIAVWHEDKTEIMNSGRPPQDGNFCLGVWEQTDPLSYRLNHFAWGANGYAPGTPDGVVGPATGPVHYQENVLLGPNGKHFSGVFTLDQYDTAGHVAVSFTGIIKATRITVDTSVGDLL